MGYRFDHCLTTDLDNIASRFFLFAPQTYDIAGHPVDINESWQLVGGVNNQEEAPASFSITCAGEFTVSISASYVVVGVVSWQRRELCIITTSNQSGHCPLE